MSEVRPDSTQTQRLLARHERGEADALSKLLRRYRPRLLRYLARRFDPRLRTRIDPSDVVQETQRVVVRRIADFLRRKRDVADAAPFWLWVRGEARQQLQHATRDHFRQCRSPAREEPPLDQSSQHLKRALLGRGPTPIDEAMARELWDRLTCALAELAPEDRECLVCRHVEDMSHAEIACQLGITERAARQRYVRALKRLQRALEGR